MTTEELIEYYASLLILQYLNKPKAKATIRAIVEPVLMDQLPVAVQDSFDIDTASGVQLDIIGKYAGASRKNFSFTRLVTLDDEDYRLLIKMKIIQNNSGSSLSDIQSLIAIYFQNALRVFDYANMHMSYYFDSAFGSEELAEIFVRNVLLPKPMGVQLGSLIYSANINNFFGMRTYLVEAGGAVGFNSYDDYQEDWPFLSYENAIIF